MFRVGLPMCLLLAYIAEVTLFLRNDIFDCTVINYGVINKG